MGGWGGRVSGGREGRVGREGGCWVGVDSRVRVYGMWMCEGVGREGVL